MSYTVQARRSSFDVVLLPLLVQSKTVPMSDDTTLSLTAFCALMTAYRRSDTCARTRGSTEDYTVQRHVQLQWIYRGYGFFQALLVLCASRGCESTCVGGCVVVARYAVGCVRRARMQKRQVASRLSAKSAGLYDHMHKTYKKCQKSCACGTWETSISTREGNAAFCRVNGES